MVSVRVLIEGIKVQGVGYRLFLLEKAIESGVEKNYARNIDKNKVELLVSDEENKVKSFYQKISSETPKEAKVESIKEEPYEGKIPIPSIDRYFHFLTLEQLSRGKEEVIKLPTAVERALKPISSSLSSLDEKFDKVVERFGLFAQYAKSMDEKLDKLPERIAKALSSKE
ncbi:MAG: acylphosphatase [Candidatus Bathyarchaeia archaeon]